MDTAISLPEWLGAVGGARRHDPRDGSVAAAGRRRTVEDLDNLRAEWKASGAAARIHAAPFEAMRALQDRLMAGMAEEGYAVERPEHTAAVLRALELPDAEERWRADEDVFRDARLKENTQS